MIQDSELVASKFSKQLSVYRKLIDGEVKNHSKQISKGTLQNYGKSSRLVTDVFLEILNRGGKRIRGALVLCGYEMSGGKDMKLALRVALAVEIMHAYILIIDDIQDRSMVRRDGPTAHVMLADHHKKNDLAGSSEHFGMSMAINGALTGSHMANSILSELETDDATKIRLISQINKTMVVTAHGQTHDIMNEVIAEVSDNDLQNVLLWKTAEYTFLNPLQMGMILAGATDDELESIKSYAEHAGKAFQISDDILGVFGNEFESGKSPMDDIREGKRTLLIAHALRNTTNGNKNFLIHMLGNKDITPAEFERCKDIMLASGALDFAQAELDKNIENSIKALEKSRGNINNQGYEFLSGLSKFLAHRTA